MLYYRGLSTQTSVEKIKASMEVLGVGDVSVGQATSIACRTFQLDNETGIRTKAPVVRRITTGFLP